MPVVITSRSRQRGVVAIMAGLTAVTLFAFGGLVLDLGHLYIAKSELQNASDAAALAGAKELNNKLSGVTAAVNKAIAIAAQHRYDFSKPVSITIANIRVASCPNANNLNTWSRPSLRSPTCTFVPAASITSDAQASGLSFLEVDTGTQSLNTYLMRVAGAAFNTTQTAGYSVAGQFLTNVTPIGVCAIDPDNKTRKYTYPDGSSELIELGFRRGVSYNIIQLNPLGGSNGTPFLINPVDAPPAACDPSHSSANFTAPFVCQGNSAVVSGDDFAGTKVYVNTGFSAGPIQRALNSRFAEFGGGSPCDPGSAPSDSNIKHFKANATPPGAAGHPRDWMEHDASVLPNRQTVSLNEELNPLNTTNLHEPNYWPFATPPSLNPNPYAPNPPPTPPTLPFEQYGALWSYTRAYHADGSSPPKAGLPFDATNAEWAKIYNGGNATTAGGRNLLSSYPSSLGSGFPVGTPAAQPSPYNQTSGDYFDAPPPMYRPGVPHRRVLNIVIVDCRAFVGSGGLSCQALDVKGIGKFFMQIPADLNGSPKRIETEFAGLVDPIPTGGIRLYR
ncbi:pilus assembly protein TadG-related protein [Aromatoleum toluolicum]|uniref:Putative Flp pilus-assembly TadG-like N-terminal domain-containing protein n=1 Tax=Aromatoleum toluolicum TaxID=90060 RepID=A0ABX1NL02_9RHOO|nr:pilus assembly protein TadG-related protein [Aromatoleum toluolicum]NMG00004.1 pilus assembly protein TadG-related protein [Aromatoleum toluolicum]